VVTHLLQRSGYELTEVAVDANGQVVASFESDTSATALDEAAALVNQSSGGGIHRVYASGYGPGTDGLVFSTQATPDQDTIDAMSGADCSTVIANPGGVMQLDSGYSILCDSTLTSRYLVGPDMVPAGSVAEATASDTGIHILLTADGTQQLAALTASMDGTDVGPQIAVVVGNEVVSAATLFSAITDGKLDISGGDDVAAPDLVDDQLRLLTNGVQFQIESIG